MRLNPLDAIWLLMESADTPMHVGVLATFEKPRNAAEDYLSEWAASARESNRVVAPWCYRLSGGAANLVSPLLVEDEDLDLDYHFRHSALPVPGGERQLGVLVSRLHSTPLDRSRPLWELHLIEGLERDRFAIYVKVHHALIDNVNAIPMMLAALSESARSRDVPPLWACPLRGSEWDESAIDEREAPSTDLIGSITTIGKTAGGLLRDVFSRGSKGSFVVPAGTPRSTLNRHINSQRRFATQQFERARIQRLADATGNTVNVILAYLCGSSLRRFFKEYNVLPDQSLIGVMPVSLSERSEQTHGNAIAGLRVALGTHIGDPLARLEAVKASMETVRKDRASLPQEAVTPYVMMRAAPIYASQMPAVGRFVPPLFNLGISNTPGPEKPMYFNGARLESIYPLGQLMQYSALSIDCVSYAGTLNIGFTGARDTLPHLQRLAVYLGQALVDLEEIVADAEDAA